MIPTENKKPWTTPGSSADYHSRKDRRQHTANCAAKHQPGIYAWITTTKTAGFAAGYAAIAIAVSVSLATHRKH
jgi:hypothetical protein